MKSPKGYKLSSKQNFQSLNHLKVSRVKISIHFLSAKHRRAKVHLHLARFARNQVTGEEIALSLALIAAAPGPTDPKIVA